MRRAYRAASLARSCANCVRSCACRDVLPRWPSKVGVSEATVSRVLNEKPGVSDATRQAVLTALDVLGYERPSKLRGERARLVGLFLPELQNPIFPAFGELVGGGLAQNGYTPVLCTQSAGGITESDYIELLLQQQVSGVVFVGGQYTQEDASHEHYLRLAELKICRPCWSARRSPHLDVPDRVDRRRRRHRAGLEPPRAARPPQDRPRAGTGRPHPVAPQAGRGRAPSSERTGVALPDAPHRALALQPRGRAGGDRPAARGGRHRRDLRVATRWRSARSARCAAPGCACRRTSRSSASTTRP